MRLCYCSSMFLLWFHKGNFNPYMLLMSHIAHSCSPRYRPSRVPSCQALTSTGWCPRCLHFLRWLYKNTREHFESYFRRCWQYLRLPDSQPVERDEAEPEPAGRIWRCIERREEILERRVLMAMSASALHTAIGCRPVMKEKK